MVWRMEVLVVNILIVAETEEAEKIRSYIEAEKPDGHEIRFFLADNCVIALEKVSVNPYLYEMLFVGRKVTDLSRKPDAEAIHRIYLLNPRILICMSMSKTFLPYEFCSIPSVFTMKSPVTRERIRSMIEQISKIEKIRYGNPASRVPVYVAEGVKLIPAASIRYARKVRNGLMMATDSGNFFNRRKMDLFEKYAGKMFLRCHGSFIVNCSHVIMLRRNRLEMDNGEIIPVSRRYQSDVRDYFKEYSIFVCTDVK